MKLMLIILAVLAHTAMSAQDSMAKSTKPTPNAATIRLSNGSVAKGWLYTLNDSQVVLLKVPAKQLKRLPANPEENNLTSVYSIDQISTIGLQKKNSTLKGALIGLGIGAFTGAIIGFVSGDDPIQPYPNPADDPLGIGTFVTSLGNAFAMTAGEKAAAYGIGLGACGAIAGIVIGALAKKKFTIGGKKEVYHDLQGDLMRRLIVQ